MTLNRTRDHIEIGEEIDTVVVATGNSLTATRNQAVDAAQLSARMQRLYSIALIDVRDGSVVRTSFPLDPAAGKKARPGRSAEFFFRVAPRVHEMTEPFSTTIVPTQNSGKFIESHGSIIKQIRVSGTTGLRPNKSLPPAIDLLREFGVDLTGFTDLSLGFSRKRLPDDEATGWDDIIFLRNIFRLYSDIKEGRRDVIAPRNVVMIWRNAKDLDFWVVEPQDFKLSQNSQSPMTYEYSIGFRTLSKYDHLFREPIDPLQSILARRRFFARLQQYGQSLGRAFSFLATQISRLDSIGAFAATTLLAPLVSLTRGILAVKTSITTFGSRTRNRARELRSRIDDALRQIAGQTQEFALTPSVSPSFETAFTLVAGERPDFSQRFPLQDPVVRTLRRIQIIASRILTEKSLQDTVTNRTSARRSEIVSRYARSSGPRGAVRPPATGGSSTFLGNEPITSAVTETTIRVGETIQDIALRCLGHRGRWHVIAVLNGLSAPYISATGGVGVLMPGDTILCPADGIRGSNAAEIGVDDNATDRDTSNQDDNLFGEVQQAYGRDVRLRSVRGGSVDLTDLVVGQNGDISTIIGIPNVDQAMKIKFATERGELAVHPDFGSAFPLGSKATTTAFTTFQIDVRNTLLSDPRVIGIESLDFVVRGDVLLTEADLRLAGSADALSTTFALRRF